MCDTSKPVAAPTVRPLATIFRALPAVVAAAVIRTTLDAPVVEELVKVATLPV